MKFKLYVITALFCLAGAVGNLCADTRDGKDAFTLGDIVVSSEKTDVTDIGITNVITNQEIEATNSSTLAEVFKFAPGITMTRGLKNEPGVSVHGFGQEKTLFLIDGIPYYETYYGRLNLDQIPTGIISKIVISKNAPSVLYGANAQVAVVNVITKKGTAKPSLGLQGEIGENGTYSTSVSHGNQIGAVNYWLSYLHRESDGWRMASDFEPRESKRIKRFMENRDGIHENGGFRNNSDYETDRLWARFGITPTPEAEYFISFNMMNSEIGHPTNINEYKYFPKKEDEPAFSSFSRYGDYDDWGIDLSGSQVVSDALTIRGKLFYHDHEDVYVSYDGPEYDDIISKSTAKDDFVGGSLFADFQFAEMHKGHVSLHYKRDTHERRDDTYLPYNEYEGDTGSFGTEHEFFTDFGLSFYVGGAYDWFDINDAEDYIFDDDDKYAGQTEMKIPGTMSEFNPMIGFTWEADQTKYYGSVAKKTRFPTMSQLYSSKGGNPELDSEQTINYTLGVTKKYGDRITVDFAGFYHDISDWISDDYYDDDYTGLKINTNTEEISMIGFETSVNIVFCDYFSMNANYTYNDAENESSQRVTDKVAGVPENKIGLGCAITIPKILAKVDLQGIYVDNVYSDLPTTSNPDDDVLTTDDYIIFNTRISRKFRDKMSLYVEVDNLFDEEYEQEIGFPGEGRNFRFGFKYDI